MTSRIPKYFKRLVFNDLLHLCPYVHFSTVYPGTVTPPNPSGPNADSMILRYGITPGIMDMPDLRDDEDGIRATVSQRGILFPTFVPWGAIYAITDKVTMQAPDCEVSVLFRVSVPTHAPTPVLVKSVPSNVIQFKPRRRVVKHDDEKEGA